MSKTPATDPQALTTRLSTEPHASGTLRARVCSLMGWFLLAAAGPALALSGGAGSAALTADSPWAGVGSLSVNGQLFTATLIAPGYVLTAAHVAAGADPTTVQFQTAGGNTFASGASAIFVNPSYTGSTVGNVPGDPFIPADLAIIRLAQTVPLSVPVYSLYGGDLLGQTVSLVSHGGSRTLATTGANRVDRVFLNAEGDPQTYLFDFDGPDLTSNQIGPDQPRNGSLGGNVEASLVDGDSGSAAFIYANGQWQLAGINTFRVSFEGGPTEQGAFGTGGAGVVLSDQLAWIQSVITAPVPEPEHWAMLLAGLGITGWASRRRQQPSNSRQLTA